MISLTNGRRKYGDADGYDSYMGGWSAALSAPFVRFVGVSEEAHVLDVGCGTGNLLSSLATDFPRAKLVGIDPSKPLLEKARGRPELSGVRLLEGIAEHLPFQAGTFDYSLSMLVLQEFPDRLLAVREMRRVTRPGGILAACQWDFKRMPVIDALVSAIAEVNPNAGTVVSQSSPQLIADEVDLLRCWVAGDLRESAVDRIEVSRTFATFDHLWRPLLVGSTPSTLMLASLPALEREEVQRTMQARFPSTETGIRITAEALVVRGRV